MAELGKLLKSKFPSLYSVVVTLVNKIIALSQPYSIYITDNLGGSFKEYGRVNDLQSKIALLQKGLDPESVEVVNVVTKRMMTYPDAKDRARTSRRKDVVGGLLPVETQPQIKQINKELSLLAKSVNVPHELMESSVFYFYHGLTFLPKAALEYIKGQHFIDLGAYVGDSAIALRKYDYEKIFSMEISQKSIARYRENMERNNIPKEKYEVINIGVAASDNEPALKLYDTGSAGLSLLRKSGKYDEIEVARKTLDTIVAQNSITPKFIKADIEGAALDFVKGAKQTLIQYRPVISIAIYHNPFEFFEIKPLLESFLPNYTFLIRKLSPGIKNNLNHSEVVLLGYPAELTQI